MLFKYKALQQDNQVVNGEVEAQDLAAALKYLSTQRLKPISVKKAGSDIGKKINLFQGEINLMDKVPEESKRRTTHGTEERLKMSRLRITIAKRLKKSQDDAAMLTTFNEVDMQNIIQTRKDYQEDFSKKYSIK